MEIWGSEDEECIMNIMEISGGEVACKSICIGNQPGQLNIPPGSRIRKENTQKWRQQTTKGHPACTVSIVVRKCIGFFVIVAILFVKEIEIYFFLWEKFYVL